MAWKKIMMSSCIALSDLLTWMEDDSRCNLPWGHYKGVPASTLFDYCDSLVKNDAFWAKTPTINLWRVRQSISGAEVRRRMRAILDKHR